MATFTAAHPDIALEIETNHRGVDPDRRDFDAWLAYTGETAAPRPVTRREDTLLEDTLYEEQLLPVCSPALLAARGRPPGPAALGGWPLLYDLGWDADWAYWCARQGQPTPDLARASGFRLYSMLVQAAVTGLGAAIGRPRLIARELDTSSSPSAAPPCSRRAAAPPARPPWAAGPCSTTWAGMRTGRTGAPARASPRRGRLGATTWRGPPPRGPIRR